MTTCVNYWNYPHQTIRHEMYDGQGPSSQGDAMLGWHQLAERLSSVRHYVDAAITGVQASQQGAAADAAVGAMTPLGAWVDEARRLAIDTGNRIDEQISAFTTAKGNVPEVPPEPRGWGWKDIPVIDSFTTSDQEIDEAFNQQQERQARAAMASYQDGTNTRLVNLTQFAPPPAGEPDLAIPTGQRSEIGGFPGAGAPGGSGGSAAAPGSPTTLAGLAGAAPAGPTAAAPAPTNPQSGGGIGGPEYAGGRPAAGGPGGSGGFLPGAPVVAGPVGGHRTGPVAAGCEEVGCEEALRLKVPDPGEDGFRARPGLGLTVAQVASARPVRPSRRQRAPRQPARPVLAVLVPGSPVARRLSVRWARAGGAAARTRSGGARPISWSPIQAGSSVTFRGPRPR